MDTVYLYPYAVKAAYGYWYTAFHKFKVFLLSSRGAQGLRVNQCEEMQ